MANSKYVLIIAALVVATVVLYFFMYFQPKNDEIASLSKRLQDVKREMQEKQEIAENLPRFNKEIADLERQLRDSLSQLPNTKEIPDILKSLAELAESSGLSLRSFTVNPEISKGFYAELPINLEVEGGYHNIAIFFDRLGKLNRIINVANLVIRNPQEIEGEVRVTATCTAITFRFLQSEIK